MPGRSPRCRRRARGGAGRLAPGTVPGSSATTNRRTCWWRTIHSSPSSTAFSEWTVPPSRRTSVARSSPCRPEKGAVITSARPGKRGVALGGKGQVGAGETGLANWGPNRESAGDLRLSRKLHLGLGRLEPQRRRIGALLLRERVTRRPRPAMSDRRSPAASTWLSIAPEFESLPCPTRIRRARTSSKSACKQDAQAPRRDRAQGVGIIRVPRQRRQPALACDRARIGRAIVVHGTSRE